MLKVFWNERWSYKQKIMLCLFSILSFSKVILSVGQFFLFSFFFFLHAPVLVTHLLVFLCLNRMRGAAWSLSVIIKYQIFLYIHWLSKTWWSMQGSVLFSLTFWGWCVVKPDYDLSFYRIKLIVQGKADGFWKEPKKVIWLWLKPDSHMIMHPYL